MKHFRNKFLAFTMLCLALTAFVQGCSSDDDDAGTPAKKACTVTFDAAGGSDVAKKIIAEGTTISEPSTIRAYYDFSGWYNGETLFDFSTPVTKDLTLTAHWTAHEYKITYELNGGTNNSANPAVYTVESGTITFQAPTKDGGTFESWNLYDYENNTYNAITEINSASPVDITLAAKWQNEVLKTEYTVTFDTNGGSEVASQTVQKGKTAEPMYPTKDYYDFGGWYDGEKYFSFFEPVLKDTTLKAKWTPHSYLITYELYGGTNNEENPSSYTVESDTITLKAPTKDNGTFENWKTYDWESNNYKDISTIEKGSHGDITVSAKWQGEDLNEKCTVTFDAAGGSKVEKKLTVKGTTVSEPSTTKNYYDFEGWYKGDTKFDFSTPITENITLTAKWTPHVYPITYELYGGTNNSENPSSYTVETPTITLKAPTKDADEDGCTYTFAGWYTLKSKIVRFGPQKYYEVDVTEITTSSHEAIKLRARWTASAPQVVKNILLPKEIELSYAIEVTAGFYPENATNRELTWKVLNEDVATVTPDPNDSSKATIKTTGKSRNPATLRVSLSNGKHVDCTLKPLIYGTKLSGETKAVGDIVFIDGSATPYSENLTLTNEQKAAAVAVIFYAFGASDVLGAKTLGVGLKNTAGSGNQLMWAPRGTTGYTTNFTKIQCTPSTMGTGLAQTANFTGDLDGSDNWAEICAVDKTAAANAATNYPAFNWCNNYATTYSLTGDYASGWYLPTVAELSMMYRAKSAVNAAIEKAGGTQIAYTGDYLSSSQLSFLIFGAYNVQFGDGLLYYGSKAYSTTVCAVRAF